MIIKLKTLDNVLLPIKVRKNYPVKVIKQYISYVKKIEPSHQRLVFKGILLEDDNKTIDDYNIESDSIVYLVKKIPTDQLSINQLTSLL